MSFKETSEWLEKQGSKLLDEPNNKCYGTARKIKYMCAKCKNIAEKQIQSIRRTGPFCLKCAQSAGIEKAKQTAKINKTNNIIPKEKLTDTKKTRPTQGGHTVSMIKNLIFEKYGAILITSLLDHEQIASKSKIKFTCKCGVEHTKALRDSDGSRDGGAYCIQCQKKHKSHMISSKQGEFMFNEETLMNLLNEYNANLISIPSGKNDKLNYNELIEYKCVCGEKNIKTFQAIKLYGALCEECVKPIATYKNSSPDFMTCRECNVSQEKEKFLFVQTTWKQQLSEYCITCREKKNKRDLLQKEKRKFFDFENTSSHKKCTKCFRIKDIDMFGNDDKCNPCCKAIKNSNLKLKHNVDLAGTMYPEQILCMKCYNLKPKNDFITEQRRILGRCCTECRNYIFERNDALAYKILELKKEKGKNGCVDCGEKDIRLLEFDHIDRKTKICDIWRCRTVDSAIREADKCVMRCIICHIRRTKIQLNYGSSLKEAKAYVDGYKMKIGGCQLCGWFDPNLLEALHFDHIEPENKIDDISHMLKTNDIDMIDEEIPKCRLICAHCHKLHTIDQLGYMLYLDKNRMDARKDKIKLI